MAHSLQRAPMSEQDIENIAKLRELTQQLLERARAEDWEAAADIENTRRPLLYGVFGQVVPGTHVRHRALLNEILAADREIIALAQQRHAELAELLRQAGQGRVALKAYGANSG